MPEITSPAPLSKEYADALRRTKAGFVEGEGQAVSIAQHGAATIAMADWPGWPSGLPATEQVIETFIAGADGVVATSDNEPYISTWKPLAEWMNTTVRAALAAYDVSLAGDAYLTASLTDVALLEGLAHMDDDTFMTTDSVGVVAIIGEHLGPRVATGPLTPQPLRPMSQVIWSDAQLQAFGSDQIDHCACASDQLVVFPQFGQLHAGPAAHHFPHDGTADTRQLLVYRAAVAPDTA